MAMRKRDRKKKQKGHYKKASTSGRNSKSCLTCKFCNVALTNVRRLAAHFRQCLHAHSQRFRVAASDGCDTATDDSDPCDSSHECEDLTGGASWDFCSRCDGCTTHCEPCLLAQTGT